MIPSLALAQGLAPVAAAVVTTAQGRLVVLAAAVLAMAHGLVLARLRHIPSFWDHYRDAYSCSVWPSIRLISPYGHRCGTGQICGYHGGWDDYIGINIFDKLWHPNSIAVAP